MHLLFDGQALQSPSSRGRGIGRYAYNLLEALRQVRPSWRISVVELGHLPPADRHRLPDGLEFKKLALPLLPHQQRVSRWFNDRAYGDWVAEYPANAYLSVNSFEGDGVHPLFGERRPPSFVILHDLIPQRFHDIYLTEAVPREYYIDRLRQTCEMDVLLANSNWTAADYRELQPAGPGRVVTVGGAPDPHFQPLAPERLQQIEADVRSKFGLTREFILNPSGQCWRKNSRGALLAFAHLPDEFKNRFDFVVACKINRAEETELRRLASQFGIRDSLRVTGLLSDEELRALYQLCRVCIFPSFYEGIGLPVVEALQCGAPVVTSDCTSLPEFAGSYSFLGDPSDIASLASALESALRESRHVNEANRIAFARTFTWSSVADRTAHEIEVELARRQHTTRHDRPRLAWVTAAMPGSPEMDRVEQMVDALLNRFAVEVVTPDDHPGLATAFNCRVPRIRAADLRDRNRVYPFAHFLYDGSSTAALPFLTELAQSYPGMLLDDAADENLLPHNAARSLVTGNHDGFLARAVTSSARWAALRPLVQGPLYCIDPDGASEPLLTGAGSRPARFVAESVFSEPTSNPVLPRRGEPATVALLETTAQNDERSKEDQARTAIVTARLTAALESLGRGAVLSHLRAA